MTKPYNYGDTKNPPTLGGASTEAKMSENDWNKRLDDKVHVSDKASGGASTVEQPPKARPVKAPRVPMGTCPKCGSFPCVCVPSEPSAKLCDFPFTEKCSQFEACVRANRCLKNLPGPSAPKVEPHYWLILYEDAGLQPQFATRHYR